MDVVWQGTVALKNLRIKAQNGFFIRKHVPSLQLLRAIYRSTRILFNAAV
jgi:hypothetical protein